MAIRPQRGHEVTVEGMKGTGVVMKKIRFPHRVYFMVKMSDGQMVQVSGDQMAYAVISK